MRTDNKRDRRRGQREMRINKNAAADASALLHLLKDFKNDNWILVTLNQSDNLMRDNATRKFHEGRFKTCARGSGLRFDNMDAWKHLCDSCATGES